MKNKEKPLSVFVLNIDAIENAMYSTLLDNIPDLAASLIPKNIKTTPDNVSFFIDSFCGLRVPTRLPLTRIGKRDYKTNIMSFAVQLVKRKSNFNDCLTEADLEKILDMFGKIFDEQDILSINATLLRRELLYRILLHKNGSLHFKDKVWKHILLEKGGVATLVLNTGYMTSKSVARWNKVPNFARVEIFFFHQSQLVSSLNEWVKTNPMQWKQDLFDVLKLKNIPLENKNIPINWLEELVKNLCKVEDEN